jgi:hypothetical protein
MKAIKTTIAGEASSPNPTRKLWRASKYVEATKQPPELKRIKASSKRDAIDQKKSEFFLT